MRMVIPHNDALLRDMIADAQRYSEKLMRRRVEGIRRMEPPDVLAFYEKEALENTRRINILSAARNRNNR